jgi:hypothetical protein
MYNEACHRNGLSRDHIQYAVLDLTDEKPDGRFRPELVSNHDEMSLVIGRPVKNRKVFIPRGATEALKALGRSPSRIAGLILWLSFLHLDGPDP